MASMEVDNVEEEEVEKDLSHPDVVTKYRAASDIANAALQHVIGYMVPGTPIIDICAAGDRYINEACSQIYNKGKVSKGVAFPTCCSVNSVVGHYSPLAEDNSALNAGDVAKIDLGVQVDGYCAVVAHTVVIADQVAGRQADVLAAAYTAAEAALRLFTPGNKNQTVTEMWKQVATDFNCTMVQGVLSHQMKRFIIDGNQVVISKSDVDQKVEEFEFGLNEAYCIDVVMSTGEGKPIERDNRTTIYKRAVDQSYQLKMKASRAVISEINSKYPTFPFTLRALEDKRARFGIVECCKHDLLQPYPVLHEKQGEYVAHFKYTVLLMAGGTLKITGLPVNTANIQTQFQPSADIQALLAQEVRTAGTKKKRNKKKSAKKAPQTDAMEM